MPRTIEIDWNGLSLTLDADRAAYAPEAHALLLADVHFGKAAAFRAHACPVPEAVTGADLDRLSALLDRYAPRRLIVLGDLLHAREAHNPATLDALRAWRDRHTSLSLTLIRGNHDIRAGDPPPDLDIDCVDPPHPFGPVDLDHHPPEVPDRPTIAGHIHPAITLRARPRASLRTRCFCFGERVAILPAFGAFTGSDTIRATPSDRIVAVGDDSLVDLTPPATTAWSHPK